MKVDLPLELSVAPGDGALAEAHADQAPVDDQASVDQVAVADQVPADQAPADQAPVDQAPVDLPVVLDVVAGDASGPTKKWTQVDSAENSTCGLLASGKLYCWGTYTLGTGSNGPLATPTQVVSPKGFGGTWVHLTTTDQNGCAIDNLGQGFCWGNDACGALGDGPGNSGSLVPVEVLDPPGFSGKWSSFSAGDFFVCGIDSAGKGYCWGRGDYGILGDGSTGIDKPAPSPIAAVSGFSGAWSKIVCGHVNSCGVDSAGKGFCWGYQIGSQPVAVPTPTGFSGKWLAIHAGVYYSCGLASDGTVYCWGDESDGCLGNGTSMGSTTTPHPIDSTKKFKMIGLDGESFHACALSTTGEILCWGANFNGEVGVPTTTKAIESPLVVSSSLTFVHVAIGEYLSCGIASSGEAYCWGYGTGGALGDGKLTSSHLPVKVVMP